jgi:hypothetical protein
MPTVTGAVPLLFSAAVYDPRATDVFAEEFDMEVLEGRRRKSSALMNLAARITSAASAAFGRPVDQGGKPLGAGRSWALAVCS